MVGETILSPHPSAHSRREALMLGGMAGVGTMLGSMSPAASAVAATADKTGGRPFEILFTLYPKFTMLDFAGPNEVLSRLPNVKVRVCSPAGGPVTSDLGIVLGASERMADVNRVDMICVPGGPGIPNMMVPEIQKELRRLADQAGYVTSVCNGALILGAAGLLKGKRSACHWAQRNLLKDYGAIPVAERVVRDGRYMSGGGVTAGIDFALAIGAILAGAEEAQAVQLLLEYRPEPPFNAGGPEIAPPEVLALVEKRLPGATAGIHPIAR